MSCDASNNVSHKNTMKPLNSQLQKTEIPVNPNTKETED